MTKSKLSTPMVFPAPHGTLKLPGWEHCSHMVVHSDRQAAARSGLSLGIDKGCTGREEHAPGAAHKALQHEHQARRCIWLPCAELSTLQLMQSTCPFWVAKQSCKCAFLPMPQGSSALLHAHLQQQGC